MRIVVSGAEQIGDVPGLESLTGRAEIVFAPDGDTLRDGLPGAEVLLGWNFRGRDLPTHWVRADNLKWIHWCGAGVDAVLFPELVAADTILTNARGVFDRAMAEYVLTYMLAETKGLRATLAYQTEKQWGYRLTATLRGEHAVIIGVGSIGAEVATLLETLDVTVTGIGRSARTDDPVFGPVSSQRDVLAAAAQADWVIGVLPLTPETTDFFTADFFAAMKPTARFINIGRGKSLDEAALVTALNNGDIAGAMLDVFREEPLPGTSALWTAPNIVISPHMSGDYTGCHADMARQFLDNFERYAAGGELANIVDKDRGYARR